MLPAARMETFTQANGLGSDLVGAMTRDAHGDLWVATLAGLSRMSGGRIVNYTTANGLSSNVITALLARANGTLLIGTQEHGWNLWDGQHFTAQSSGGLNKTSIHAILDDGSGHLWFATGNGIARCDSDGKSDCSHWIEFGAADGLRSRETATNSHPSAWRSRDGAALVCDAEGTRRSGPGALPGEHRFAASGAGAICRGRSCLNHCMRQTLSCASKPAMFTFNSIMRG